MKLLILAQAKNGDRIEVVTIDAAAGFALVRSKVWGKTEGYLRLDTCVTRSRMELDGTTGSSAPAPHLKQSCPSRLVGMCLQPSYSANGKWGDAAVQVLAQDTDSTFHIHFLSPADLEPLRTAQRLPLLDPCLAQPPGVGDVRLLPCTVTADGRAACNLHVTDGRQVLTVQAHSDSEVVSVLRAPCTCAVDSVCEMCVHARSHLHS